MVVSIQHTPMHDSDWRPSPGLDSKRKREVWDHRGPHEISDGEVDGEIEFDDEVLEGFGDDD